MRNPLIPGNVPIVQIEFPRKVGRFCQAHFVGGKRGTWCNAGTLSVFFNRGLGRTGKIKREAWPSVERRFSKQGHDELGNIPAQQ